MMTTDGKKLQDCLDIIQHTNQIATSIDLDEMLAKMLALLVDTAQAQVGVIYLYDATNNALSCRAVQGTDNTQQDTWQYLDTAHNMIYEVLHTSQPVFVLDVQADPIWKHHAPGDILPQTLYCVPIVNQKQPLGLVQLFGVPHPSADAASEFDILQLVVDRLKADIEKNRLLSEQRHLLAVAKHREKRLESLIDFISHITTTLERKQLIRLIMAYAEQLLDVETTSFWLLDERVGKLKLLVVAGDTSEIMNEVSVNVGEGIIGHVVQSGERKVVNDVRNDPLFNTKIDLQSGYVTRSMLTVPMRAPKIQRGDLRGEVKETIIGGAQALNKRDGSPFTEEDIRCFETLARQAAIAFQFSNLFEEDVTLFWGVIGATTSAIDLIDPYTRGHSDRVSDFSVAIAEDLGLPAEEIYRVRVGSMLHDVGKIGVSEQVLKKPGRLTDNEFDEIKRHPMYGFKLFQEAGLGELLHEELLALAQHHERLDGQGYPNGLAGDQISRIGRIVAVADTFDALTSDRPYRAALPVEKAFNILCSIAGTELDAECVEALIRARNNGKIVVQREREGRAVG